MEKINDLKTFENAVTYLGDNNKNVLAFRQLEKSAIVGHILAYSKLVIVVEAANKLDNDGNLWIPDFTNWDQTKYEIWWEFDKSSSGFRCRDYDYWTTVSYVGSRLCFKSRDGAKYIAKQFESLYNEYL